MVKRGSEYKDEPKLTITTQSGQIDEALLARLEITRMEILKNIAIRTAKYRHYSATVKACALCSNA
jgi:hypothetical protein